MRGFIPAVRSCKKNVNATVLGETENCKLIHMALG